LSHFNPFIIDLSTGWSGWDFVYTRNWWRCGNNDGWSICAL